MAMVTLIDVFFKRPVPVFQRCPFSVRPDDFTKERTGDFKHALMIDVIRFDNAHVGIVYGPDDACEDACRDLEGWWHCCGECFPGPDRW